VKITGLLASALLLLACSGSELPSVDADAAPTAAKIPGTKVYDRTVLHELELTVAPAHVDQLENDREHRVPCTLVFDGVTVANAGIRQKGGNGSISDLQGKPGFSIKLDEFVHGQKLDGLKKLTVNNAIQDPSLLNETIGYELYRRAGLPAPRTAHVVVTLNGFTYGVYVLAESVDGDFLARSFGAGNHKGNLYEGTLGVDFVSAPEQLELKDEDEGRTRDDLVALAQAIQNAPAEQFVAQVGERLDLDGFIKGYAIDALVNHWDGYSFSPNNYYLYDHPGTQRFVYIPHGMDQLFQDLSMDPYEQPKGLLSQRVRDLPELDQRFKDAIHEVLEQAWDVPALVAQIDEVASVLHATTHHEERVVSDLQAFDDNLAYVKAALAQRKEQYQEAH
jgi:spore coat protein H